MFDKRCASYESIGYTVLLPGSAVPGWPAEIPLPIDPEWKRDYAASVRRLIQDGVNMPLADLFIHATVKTSPQTIGTQHARSATEAFLFRRLETLPQTTGLFRINFQLPIPFDEHGTMEIDLFCEKFKIAIEIDGPQHFADTDAYRRDRKKDMLLHEHGYHILRFLAEDIGKRLNQILDDILRTLVHCKHKSAP
jgi:very-short-patch-repair endonuclease